jgi:hypothetical protein
MATQYIHDRTIVKNTLKMFALTFLTFPFQFRFLKIQEKMQINVLLPQAVDAYEYANRERERA